MAYSRVTLTQGTGVAVGTANFVVVDQAGTVSFSVIPDNNTVRYIIQDNPADALREWGLGTKVTVAGSPVIQRTAGGVIGGSNGAGVLVNFTGPRQVIYVAPLGEVDDTPNVTADPIASVSTLGQRVYRTDTDRARIYIGPTPTWQTIATIQDAISGTSTTDNFFNITRTLPAVCVAGTTGISYQITSAGSDTNTRIAFEADLLSGYTGSGTTLAIRGINNAAGTGAGSLNNGPSNNAFIGNSLGSGSGHNIGGKCFAANGAMNIGLVGFATTAVNNGDNIGIHGRAVNTGSGGLAIGAYFTTTASAVPPTESEVLLLDNASSSFPLVVAKNNSNETYRLTSAGNEIFSGLDNASVVRNQFLIVNGFKNNATASFAGQVDLQLVDFNATRTFLHAESNGTATLIGVFGGGPATQQTVTGSRGGNAALASLLTALASFGWIIDSSS